MIYLKCHWNEPRAAPFGDWGCSWWFFEFGSDGAITRRVEVYDSGVRLRYGLDHLVDKFGWLEATRLEQLDMPGAEEITADQFKAMWESVKSNGQIH